MSANWIITKQSNGTSEEVATMNFDPLDNASKLALALREIISNHIECDPECEIFCPAQRARKALLEHI